ncbi:secreted protein, partial [Candidatus Thiomargarita nelsonii]
MRITRYLLLFMLFTLSACLVPQNNNPPESNNSPILQIDPGGHSAIINDVVYTPDGKY